MTRWALAGRSTAAAAAAAAAAASRVQLCDVRTNTYTLILLPLPLPVWSYVVVVVDVDGGGLCPVVVDGSSGGGIQLPSASISGAISLFYGRLCVDILSFS
jgi:hypothetical protein